MKLITMYSVFSQISAPIRISAPVRTSAPIFGPFWHFYIVKKSFDPNKRPPGEGVELISAPGAYLGNYGICLPRFLVNEYRNFSNKRPVRLLTQHPRQRGAYLGQMTFLLYKNAKMALK